MVEVPPGAGSRSGAGKPPVRLARAHAAPFTDRLVAKFDLPVLGWRGAAERKRNGGTDRSTTPKRTQPEQQRSRQRDKEPSMLAEIRITGLGVIEDATLDLDPGFTAVTGETGAGKTMVVTGVNMLLGGRADSGLVRHGTRPRAGRGPGQCGAEGDRAAGRGPRRRAGRRRAADRRANSPPRAGPGRSWAVRRCRCRCWARCPATWSRSTARPSSGDSCSRRGSARPSTRSPGSRCSCPLQEYAARLQAPP